MPTRYRLLIGAIALSVTLALLAACGGSGDPTATTAPTSTPAPTEYAVPRHSDSLAHRPAYGDNGEDGGYA